MTKESDNRRKCWYCEDGILIWSGDHDLCTNVQRCFDSEKAAQTARGNLLSGKGIGRDAIIKCEPEDDHLFLTTLCCLDCNALYLVYWNTPDATEA